MTREAADLFHAAALAMQKAVIAGNVIAFLEADKALDEAIAATADNPFAARVAAPLQTHSRRFWFRYQSDTGLAASAERHVALICAILDGDADGAGEEAGQLIALCGSTPRPPRRGRVCCWAVAGSHALSIPLEAAAELSHSITCW